jgi:predicted metalloprotease with PDZ domain
MMAGKSLEPFFSRYVRGTAEIDYNAIVSGIGLELERSFPERGRAYFGADLAESDGQLTIRTIRTGTPAYEQGLNTGDQIVAIDGYRASQSFMQSYFVDRKPGDRVRLSIFRFDKLREMDFTLGESKRESFSFSAVSNPTDEQKRLYREYMNAELR